jgi:hypothetical protein
VNSLAKNMQAFGRIAKSAILHIPDLKAAESGTGEPV